MMARNICFSETTSPDMNDHSRILKWIKTDTYLDNFGAHGILAAAVENGSLKIDVTLAHDKKI